MSQLQQHMVDTVKEWQLKIGVQREKMDLFYPLEDLKDLLGLKREASIETLEKSLTQFQTETKELFGDLHFWKEKPLPPLQEPHRAADPAGVVRDDLLGL